MTDDLEKRVTAFRMMELPGQPMMMHMGTSYLVNDLWTEVLELREWRDKAFDVHPNIDLDIERLAP